MNKTWRNIIIVSLVFVLIEAAVVAILFKPYYDCYKVYKSIENGNWIEAQEEYNSLSSSKQNRVQRYLPEYAKWLANQYAEGNIKYENTAAAFDAVNAIDESKNLYSAYMYDISKNEYVNVINGMYNAANTFNTTEAYNYRQTLNAINQRLGYDVREEILVNMLNIEYEKFLNEEITSENIDNFYNLVIGNSYYDAYNYAYVIKNNVECVRAYRSVYENALANYNESKYFETMELCKLIVTAPEDMLYQKKISELYASAYEDGKEYYQNLIREYAAKEDKNSAVELMAKVEMTYGDDVDLSQVKEDMAEAWQLAAIDLIEDWETDLKEHLSGFSSGQYILEHKYTDFKPDSVLLYDVDGDMIPELFLFNESRVNNEYVECFVYVYDDEEEKYDFSDYINVKNFCVDSNIIAFPYALDRTPGDECMLVSYNGSGFYNGNMCQIISDVHYVNGAETDDLEYLETQTEILSHMNERTVGNSGYSSIETGESYILAY